MQFPTLFHRLLSISDAQSLVIIGFLKLLVKALEKICLLHAGELEEPSFALFMGFSLAISKYVQDRQISHFAEVATDEDCSMACEGVPFRAHERDLVVLHSFPDTPQTLKEGVCVGNPVILNPALGIVARGIGGATP